MCTSSCKSTVITSIDQNIPKDQDVVVIGCLCTYWGCSSVRCTATTTNLSSLETKLRWGPSVLLTPTPLQFNPCAYVTL